jgi:polyisoprenoid-binding protein YceI
MLSLLLAVPALALSAERTVVVDPAASRLAFKLGTTFHEVHGTMAVTGGAIRFDPDSGTASGTVTVDARSAETGHKKRDKTMHADVLVSERWPAIVFRVDRVEGPVAVAGRSELRLAGVMTLCGADHPLALAAAVEIDGDRVRGDTSFTIPYVEWGLHDPSFLIARAEKTVDVTIHLEGRLEGAAGEGR